MAITQSEEFIEQRDTIRKFFKHERTRKGLSQREMAARMNMTQPNYQRLEAGHFSDIRVSTLQAWADALGYGIEFSVVPLEQDPLMQAIIDEVQGR